MLWSPFLPQSHLLFPFFLGRRIDLGQLPRGSTHRRNLAFSSAEHAVTTRDDAMSAHGQIYATVAAALTDDVVNAADPSPDRANDLLAALERECRDRPRQPVTIAILESTKVGKALTKAAKACKRARRTSDDKEGWDKAISTAEELLATFKEAAHREERQRAAARKAADTAASQKDGLPASTSAYKARLVSQKKEMYKDPPALPPAHIVVEPSRVAKPKRSKTGELTFVCGEDDAIRAALKDFHPNRTPEEVLRAGSFGGTYFRAIASAVTNVKYSPVAVLKDTVEPGWIAGLDAASMLTSQTYRVTVNNFGVKCGGSLGMWESSGWIADSDPYGWFQWYCRFYAGRRCSDDARQIGRWCKSAGLKGRFRSQLCNKIIAAGTTAGDARISPVIRQTLLHWGLEVTEDILEKHKRR